jgi:hypothetical protein
MSTPETKLTVETCNGAFSPAPSITFHNANREVLRITHDGRLIIGEGLSTDEATQVAAKMLVDAFEQEIQKMLDARAAAELVTMNVPRREKSEAELTEAKANFKEERTFLISAIKELNAERDRLRALSDQLSDNLSAVGAAYNAEKARAEKAEAKLHALTLICGTSDANKFQSWVDKERERADEAEAECLEQARLLGLSGNEVAMLKSKVFRLTSLWSQFFFLLDITEESDSGNAFKPNYFSSCRIADAESMEKILTKAKHELNAGVNKQDL